MAQYIMSALFVAGTCLLISCGPSHPSTNNPSHTAESDQASETPRSYSNADNNAVPNAVAEMTEIHPLLSEEAQSPTVVGGGYMVCEPTQLADQILCYVLGDDGKAVKLPDNAMVSISFLPEGTTVLMPLPYSRQDSSNEGTSFIVSTKDLGPGEIKASISDDGKSSDWQFDLSSMDEGSGEPKKVKKEDMKEKKNERKEKKEDKGKSKGKGKG